jgi:hypothetical protein
MMEELVSRTPAGAESHLEIKNPSVFFFRAVLATWIIRSKTGTVRSD